MIQCPNCKTMHPFNTLYCNECGEYLGTDSRATEAFNLRKPNKLEALREKEKEEQKWEAPQEEKDKTTTGSSTLTLIIGQQGHRISLPLKNEILLGRQDPANNNYPDVDLAEYGGAAQGISRRHARIACQQQDVVLEDLGSINGSFVNGKQLSPYLAHPLKSGDIIQLGKMSIKIIFSWTGGTNGIHSYYPPSE